MNNIKIINNNDELNNNLSIGNNKYLKKYLFENIIVNDNDFKLADNAKKMEENNKNYNNHFLSENLSTNRNFNNLLVKSKTNLKNDNRRLMDNLLLTKKIKNETNNLLNFGYIKSKYFRDSTTIKNLAVKTSKNTFDYVKNKTQNINYENGFECVLDFVIKTLMYLSKFILVIIWNIILLFKSIFLIIIRNLNNLFFIWKKKKGINDLDNETFFTSFLNNEEKKENNKGKQENNEGKQENNKGKQNIKKKEIIYENDINNKKEIIYENDINNKKVKTSQNKFFEFFNNKFNSVNNFFNNSFPKEKILEESSTAKIFDNSYPLKKISVKKSSISSDTKKKISGGKIMKYYPIKYNDIRSYNTVGKRKLGRTKINLKLGKKLGRELRQQLESNKLKSKKKIKKSITEIYHLLN